MKRCFGSTAWLVAVFCLAQSDQLQCEAFSATTTGGGATATTVPKSTLSPQPHPNVHTRQPTALQRKAHEIVSTFQPDTSFDPLWTNCHVQTIGGYFLRDTPAAYLPRGRPIVAAQRVWQGLTMGRSALKVQATNSNGIDEASDDTRITNASSKDSFWDERERVATPDGDFFDVDIKYVRDKDGQPDASAPLVLLLHGLESNSDSDLSRQLATACLEQAGFSCACLNFRSCSTDENGNIIPNTKLGAYHLGFTDDFRQYLEICAARRPHQKRYVMGFSLGANVALKALGELGDDAVETYNIRGAALLCTPFDQERNARALAQPGINRVIYTNSLLKSLKKKAQDKLDEFCNGDADTTEFDYQRAMEAETITMFDDAFIAPIYNFEDCWDYYTKTSSIHYMDNVAVPTYSINAADGNCTHMMEYMIIHD